MSDEQVGVAPNLPRSRDSRNGPTRPRRQCPLALHEGLESVRKPDTVDHSLAMTFTDMLDESRCEALPAGRKNVSLASDAKSVDSACLCRCNFGSRRMGRRCCLNRPAGSVALALDGQARCKDVDGLQGRECRNQRVSRPLPVGLTSLLSKELHPHLLRAACSARVC